MADLGSCVTSGGLWPAIAILGGLLYHAIQRSRQLKAELDYTKKSAKRREYIEDRKAEARAEAETVVAAAESERAEAKAELAAEEAKVETTAASDGLAKAASDHVKRLRGLVAFVVTAFAASTVRASPCPEGRTVMSGQVLDCDAECLPAEDLDFLLKRSLKLIEVEADLEFHRTISEARIRELNLVVETYEDAYAQQEEACAAALGACASSSTSTETYIFAAVGIFVVGFSFGIGAALLAK